MKVKLEKTRDKLASRLDRANAELAEAKRQFRETALTITRPVARCLVPQWRMAIFHFLRQGGIAPDLAATVANLEADAINRRLLFVREHESMARLRRMARREAWGQLLDRNTWLREEMRSLRSKVERRRSR